MLQEGNWPPKWQMERKQREEGLGGQKKLTTWQEDAAQAEPGDAWLTQACCEGPGGQMSHFSPGIPFIKASMGRGQESLNKTFISQGFSRL